MGQSSTPPRTVPLGLVSPAPHIALAERRPVVAAERLIAEMVPPPRFQQARFSTYIPDPQQPSQAEAVRVLEAFAAGLTSRDTAAKPAKKRWFGRGTQPAETSGPGGVYLDGGYGVGKTHLLASLWHATPGPKAFGTFVELTNLVGALGFQQAVQALSGHTLLCIDEFELDDPGDTVLVSTLLTRLAEAGVKLAATSNTLPGKLGEGRFAATDFMREIQGLASRFRSLRIDGQDYRHRGLPEAPPPYSDAEVTTLAASHGEGASLDDFDALLTHLSDVHPSRYGALLDGVDAVFVRGVTPVPDQSTALRLVVLADRMYDRELPIVASGAAFDSIFSEEMLNGGYKKKYFRAISRLVALARDSKQIAAAG
ncbi:cell division protein ZapE [Streptacidiphilus jiangxiensis]|uniref:Cell division protein ZapE n=2 Tax=Streptacidiphilus jiangxiensis TaxID=235985 RepID=A0A1H7L1I3_STRJI|nr:cell division protein ZapE [Streptacidiphilus jiangxiensis]SEK92852.1 cell division protein ZapE [Streptacidiphilus jiangxiensis]